MSILTLCRKVSRVTLLPDVSTPRVASCDPLRPRLVVAEILKRNVESVSGAKLAPSSPGVKTVGLLQAGHEPCARRVGAMAKAASRVIVKYRTGLLLHKPAVNMEECAGVADAFVVSESGGILKAGVVYSHQTKMSDPVHFNLEHNITNIILVDASESLNGSGVEAYAKGGYKGECDLPYICLGFVKRRILIGFSGILANA